MVKISKALMFKRVLVFLIGLFLAALGVAVSVRSNMGVSPVNSLAKVLSEVFTFFSMGVWTIIVFTSYVIIIFIIERKISPLKLLQVPVAVIFGMFVDLCNSIVSAILPEPPSYFVSIIYLLCSMVILATGILSYISPNLLVMPAEGLLATLVETTKKPQHICKICIDGTSMVLSVCISLIAFGTLVGVREGTILAAFGVGIAMKFVSKPLHAVLDPFLELTPAAKAKEKDVEEAEESI